MKKREATKWYLQKNLKKKKIDPSQKESEEIKRGNMRKEEIYEREEIKREDVIWAKNRADLK